MRKNLLLEKAVKLLFSTFAFLLLLFSIKGFGQLSITTAGTAVTQNFDGMGSSGTATIPSGFKINAYTSSPDWSTGTTAVTQAYGTSGTGVVTGTSGGGIVNWANGVTASATDRALGFLPSGSNNTTPNNIILKLTNNTGITITNLNISFDYEKYRSGSRQFDWTFFHGSSTNPTTAAAAGNQTYLADTNNTTINNPPATISKTVSLTGLSIANGASYYLKWTYTPSGGSSTNGQGIGIDNFSITATAAASPTISGAATATAFTTTYGTASTAQTFNISGANLTANLVATAPTGFEVSADGTTYGTTATFTQTSGTASGTLSARLKANAAVSGNYNAQNIVLSSTGATSVNITTAASGNAVSPKALTITANDRTKVYGNTLTLGTSEFTSSGLVNSETIGSVTLSAAGAASTATTAVGTYPITPSAATGGTFTASNYSITYVNGTLTVTKADQTITFGTLSAKTYGDSSFDLTGTASSGLPLSYSSSDTNVATISGNTVTIVGSGSTTITATQTGDDNHNAATSVEQVLTVNKKTLTITGISAEDKTFDGTTVATLTGTPSLVGVVGTDDVSLTGTPTATFASSSVGHAIAVTVSGYSLTGAKAGDYELQQPSLVADIIATTPTLFASGSLEAFTTTYGTASSSKSFSVSGQSLTDVITITAPSGFEVSSGGGAYASSITVGGAENVSSTTIDVRLSSTAKPVDSPFSGDIVVSSPGATSLHVSTVSSTVAPKGLTISGLTGVDKVYDGTTAVTVIGTATLNGVVNNDDVSISGTHVFAFVDANAGSNKAITASGFTLDGLDHNNYTVAQPTGLTATISKADQTITAIAATVSKTFGDATYSIATTASSGLAVSYASSNTAVATVSADGTVTIVGGGTATLTASQSGNTNYNAATSVTQELTVGKADQTISAITSTMTKSYGDSPYSIATTASSGLAVTYASSNTAVATVAANGTVTIVGAGSTTLTAAQSGNTNYNAATSVTQELTVGKANQTITFNAFSGLKTNTSPINLNTLASTSSGLPLTFTSSNTEVATISGNTMTIVGVGSTNITAKQVGNDNYFPAVDAVQVATVTLTPSLIAGWDFQTTTNGGTAIAAAPNTPKLFTANFGNGTLFLNGTNGSSNFITATSGNELTAFGGTAQNTTTGDGFSIATSNGALAIVNGSSNSANGKSIVFLVNMTNYRDLNISYATQKSSTGFNKQLWEYSTDGNVWTEIASITPTTSFAVATLSNITAINGITNAYVRLTFSGSTGTSQNNRLDNFKFEATLSQPTITSSLTASGKVGTAFNYNVTASSITSNYSATGLPTGLSINTATGLISGTPTVAGNFDVTIGATNAAGTDAKTLVINIAKGDQTITFEPLSDKLDTVGTFTLSATASSGLNVTYTSSNTSVLTIAGNVATILAPGVTTITASQAGDDNYNAATDVSQDQKIVDSTITVWDGTAWSNGEPTSSLKAILDGDYDGSSFESQTLTVNAGKTLTVNSFVKTGNVTNNGNIIVANGANFLQVGSFNSGDGATFKVRKDTKAVKRLAYMNWSSPMANSSQTLKQFSYGKNANGTAQSSTGTLDNRFYTYNNNAYVLTAPSGTFTKGQGYLIRTPNDFNTTPQIFHAQFEGTIPNAGTITYDHSSLQGNFILLGNPYPSAISYDDFISQNTNTTGTVYVWNSQVEMVNNQYAGTIYNTFTSAGANPANSLDAYIPVGQGFFVQRTNNDPFVFTDTMRRTTEVGVTSKSSTVSKNRFWLELTSPSGAKPQMLLGFFSATTKGIDKGYDAILLDATTETLYSTVEDKKLIIDAHGGFDEADEFSLSANLTAGGNYTISLLQKEGIFSNGQKIYLKDNLTGSVTDLTTDKYEFTETAGLKSNRFTLQFKSSGVLGSQDLAKEELNIISVGKEVRIKAGQNVATVEIYDLTGKKLIKVQPNQRETVINLSTEGMIVVKVTLQNGREKSKKLIIK